MAVVDKTRELHQLVFGNLEVRVKLFIRFVSSRCPAHSEHRNRKGWNQEGVFPSSLVSRNLTRRVATKILVDYVPLATFHKIS